MSLDRIDIEGTFNFRDLGGAPVSGPDDPVITTGRVYRSDGLAQLTDRARADISRLGIRTVIDLRDFGERSKLPDALGDLDVDYIELPIFEDHFFPATRQSEEQLREFAERTGMDLRHRSLDKIYQLMITQFGKRLALAVDTVAETCEDGVVFHCSAGKDRTGMVAAFIQELLGVDRDDIIADYSVTQDHLSGAFLEAITRNFADAGISGNLAETATAAPPELLARTLDSIIADYGELGVEAYLLDHGMNPQTPQRLREKLIVVSDSE